MTPATGPVTATTTIITGVRTAAPATGTTEEVNP
jgi:hypothetical protein